MFCLFLFFLLIYLDCILLLKEKRSFFVVHNLLVVESFRFAIIEFSFTIQSYKIAKLNLFFDESNFDNFTELYAKVSNYSKIFCINANFQRSVSHQNSRHGNQQFSIFDMAQRIENFDILFQKVNTPYPIFKY